MVIRRRSNSHCEPFRSNNVRAFLRGLQASTWVTCGWSRSYNQADQVPSAKVTCKLPRRPRINDEAMALVLINFVHIRLKRLCARSVL
jgi:hypothetical protein